MVVQLSIGSGDLVSRLENVSEEELVDEVGK